MSVKVQWSGLNELLRALGSLPRDLQSEGMGIVRDETEGAAVEMAHGYEKKSGKLARSVRTIYPASNLLIGIAQAKAPHSHLYEFGTEQRRTASGANRGRMPERAVTVPIARRRRANMARRLVDMLRRYGFRIGDA